MSHSYQTWFTWLSENWCLCVWVAWPCDHEVRITLISNLIYFAFQEFGVFRCGLCDHMITRFVSFGIRALALLIRLHPSEIFISCWFRKINNFSNVQFLLLLEFVVYYKKYKKEEKKVVQKIVICFCLRKLNRVKLDQINSELSQSLYSDYRGPNRTTY